MTAYYVKIGEKAYGPLDIQKLQALAQRGRVNQTTPIRIEGQTWQPASAVPELFAEHIA